MSAAEAQRQFYNMLMESQYWSPAAMLDYQRSQLAQLLRHARKHVPFYAARLDPVFTASGDIDWERWHEIPIVKRADLVERKESMRCSVLPAGHGPVSSIKSSGSTGHAIEALVTRVDTVASKATAWRAGTWHEHDYSKRLLIRNGSELDIVPPKPRELGFWAPPWADGIERGRSYRLPRWWTVADQLDAIERLGIGYLAVGSTKAGYALALAAERRGSPPRLSRIFVSGEEVSEEDRVTCRRVFGAEIIDLYSSKEGGHMAHRCPTGGGYHVNSERVLVELLDEKDQPVPVGVSGRVVVTPFYSTAQPLIRYDHGDLATWAEPCGCGRTLPLLASVDGRTGAIFRHPDGRMRARGMDIKHLETLRASMWQFAQVGSLDYEIRYVPRDADKLGDEAQVAEAFRLTVFDDARITFKRLEAIPLTASGKYMEYVNETGASDSNRTYY